MGRYLPPSSYSGPISLAQGCGRERAHFLESRSLGVWKCVVGRSRAVTMGDNRLGLLEEFRGLVSRDTDRAQRTYLRSEGFRMHAVDRPRDFARDAPWTEHSGGEDPPASTEDSNPSNAILGDKPSSSGLEPTGGLIEDESSLGC